MCNGHGSCEQENGEYVCKCINNYSTKNKCKSCGLLFLENVDKTKCIHTACNSGSRKAPVECSDAGTCLTLNLSGLQVAFCVCSISNMNTLCSKCKTNYRLAKSGTACYLDMCAPATD